MKRLISLSILIVLFGFIFSTTVQVGQDVVFYSKDGGMKFKDVVLLSKFLSQILLYDPPKLSKSGNFVALHFNGKTMIYDGKKMILPEKGIDKEELTPKTVLDYFYIPYTIENGAYIIPEAVITNIKNSGKVFVVEYYGNPAFVYKIISSRFSIVSTGYVQYFGEIYPPGMIIYSKRVGNYSIGQIKEERVRDTILLVSKSEEKKIFLYPYGSTLVKPLPAGNVGVIIAKGEGSVIVRPHSVELRGLEDEFMEKAYKLGEKVSKELGYKFERFPLLKMPPASTYIMVLVKDEMDFMKLKKLLKELTGIEKVVDLVNDFNSLPYLGPNG